MPPSSGFYVRESERLNRGRERSRPAAHTLSKGNVAVVGFFLFSIITAGTLFSSPERINVPQAGGASSWNLLKELEVSILLAQTAAEPGFLEYLARSVYQSVSTLLLTLSSDGEGTLATSTTNIVVKQQVNTLYEGAPRVSTTTVVEVGQFTRAPGVVTVPAPERVVERVVVPGISEKDVDAKIQQLDNKYASKLAEVTAANSQQVTNTYQVISQTNKIDSLSSVTVDSSTLRDATLSGTVTVSGALSNSNTATSTFANGISISSGCLSVNGTCLSSGGSTFLSLTDTPSSFTANRIVHTNSAGTALADTAGFVFNGTNLGIGTTSPFATLSVTGTGSFDDYVRASSFIATSTTATSTFSTGGLTVGTSQFVVQQNSGNVGIGTTSPAAKLHIGTSDNDGILFSNSSSGGKRWLFGVSGNDFHFDETSVATSLTLRAGGNVGIGTTTPWTRLSVADTIASAQFTVAYDTTRYATFQVDSSGDLIVNPQGDDAFLNDDNLWVCTGGSCPANTPTGTGNLIVENKVGVGTTTPTEQLSVANLLYVGAGGASGLGTATSTFQGDVKILGKLDVSTIDPIYKIGGVKYATYGHSTVGVKEEVVVNVYLTEKNAEGKYTRTISFPDFPRGSDLWLFSQITDFGKDWQDLVVSLTPGFDGRAFYTKEPGSGRLVLTSTESGEVAVRLVANRFDSSRWSNVRLDQDDPFTHFTLDEK